MDKTPDKVLDLETQVHALLLLLNKLESRVERLEHYYDKVKVMPPDYGRY